MSEAKRKLRAVAVQAQELAGEMSAYADLLSLLAGSVDDDAAARVLETLEANGVIDESGRMQVDAPNPALN